MTDDEIIAVVSAHKEGKQIQYRHFGMNWMDFTGPAEVWCFCGREYRVKPEPRKPREWIVFEGLDGKLHPIGGHTGTPGVSFRVREVIEE